jgi:hypothetical protein
MQVVAERYTEDAFRLELRSVLLNETDGVSETLGSSMVKSMESITDCDTQYRFVMDSVEVGSYLSNSFRFRLLMDYINELEVRCNSGIFDDRDLEQNYTEFYLSYTSVMGDPTFDDCYFKLFAGFAAVIYKDCGFESLGVKMPCPELAREVSKLTS